MACARKTSLVSGCLFPSGFLCVRILSCMPRSAFTRVPRANTVLRVFRALGNVYVWTTPRGSAAPRFGLPRLLRSGFLVVVFIAFNANRIEELDSQQSVPRRACCCRHNLSTSIFVNPPTVRMRDRLSWKLSNFAGKSPSPSRSSTTQHAIPSTVTAVRPYP